MRDSVASSVGATVSDQYCTTGRRTAPTRAKRPGFVFQQNRNDVVSCFFYTRIIYGQALPPGTIGNHVLGLIGDKIHKHQILLGARMLP